ncbi:MAG: hypothetical protein ACRYG6_07330, partial [Janthinobacterium lividum]
MDTPVDASILLSEPGHDPQGAVLAAERRRNGRPSYVSRSLVPLLRVTPPADGALSSTPDAASLRAAKACAACRDGTQIFPFTMAFQP